MCSIQGEIAGGLYSESSPRDGALSHPLSQMFTDEFEVSMIAKLRSRCKLAGNKE